MSSQPSIFSKRTLCQEAFDWLMGHFSNQALLQFAQADNERRRALSFGGFQLTVSTVRSKTMLMRLAQGDMPRQLLDKLACMDGPWQPLINLLAVVDEKWMLAHWRNLLEDFDCPQDIAFAMTRLEPPAVKRLGNRLLKIPSVWRGKTPSLSPEAPVPFYKKQLMEAAASLCASICKQEASTAPQTQPNQKAAETAEPEASSPKLQDKLLKEQARRREIQREFNDFQQKAKEQEQALKAKISELTLSLHETRDSIARRLREQDLQHDALLKEFLEQHFGSHDDLALKAEQAQSTSDALLLTIEKIIEEQKQLDQKHGLKTRLREQQAKLASALEKLKAITLDSTVVHPAIRRLIPQTEQQIAELQNAINGETDEIPLSHTALQLYTELQNIHVNTPETEAELKRLQDFIETSEQHGLILPGEKETLFNLIAKQQELHQNIRQLKSKHFLPKSAEAEEILHRDKQVILVMANFLAVLPSVNIVIDACNVILKNGSHWERIINSTAQNGFTTASRQFIERCRKKSHFFNSITIIFDSVNQLSTIETDGNMTVVYARRIQEEHNADLAIIDKIAGLHESSEKVWLVTDDTDLKNAVVDTCDAYVIPEAFTNFILV
ncbi:MAG: NYN domain-containing protein [Victivallales bacterium]|nr:NYN domain-containing protein [Victivallales bacterium]